MGLEARQSDFLQGHVRVDNLALGTAEAMRDEIFNF